MEHLSRVAATELVRRHRSLTAACAHDDAVVTSGIKRIGFLSFGPGRRRRSRRRARHPTPCSSPSRSLSQQKNSGRTTRTSGCITLPGNCRRRSRCSRPSGPGRPARRRHRPIRKDLRGGAGPVGHRSRRGVRDSESYRGRHSATASHHHHGLLWTHAEEADKALMDFVTEHVGPCWSTAISRGHQLSEASNMLRGMADRICPAVMKPSVP